MGKGLEGIDAVVEVDRVFMRRRKDCGFGWRKFGS